ncbi:MAG: hypothetical protein ACE5GA_10605, partial [Candidatus Zixiibacteriota bacterium]
MEHKPKPVQINPVPGTPQHSAESESGSNTDVTRRKRAESILNAKKALELADKLRLMSLNVAIQSAKTRGSSRELRKIKSELSTLTNQAVKASRELGAIIGAISPDTSGPAAVQHDYRKALRLKTDLEAIL